MLCAGAATVFWLWRRASSVQLNVFRHRTLWLLAIGAFALAMWGGSSDEWKHDGPARMSQMDGLQWSVLALTVIVPVWIAARSMRAKGNAFSGGAVKGIALGLVAWAALGFFTRDLFYGCNPLSPTCKSVIYRPFRIMLGTY